MTKLVATVLATVWIGTLWAGWDYYALSSEARLEAPLHLVLSPGGPWGLLLGIVGTVQMIVATAWICRKYLPATWWVGRPEAWMRLHVVFGIGGPAYIVLHAALLPPAGLIAVGFWSMVAVFVSGLVGRLFRQWVPTRILGLFGSWRLLHGPLVIALAITASLHILGAVLLGGSVMQLVRVIQEVL